MTAPAPARLDWTPLLEDLPEEHGFSPLEVEGTIPEDLQGTLYRVGPGLFSNFGRRYGHLFDADGVLTAIRLQKGEALGACKVLDTEERKKEQRAGKPLYFGFGTRPPVFPRSLQAKNAANTNVLSWNDRLYCLYEARLPTQVDPEALSVIGESDLDGVLKMAFSAHPHFCPSRASYFNFGLRVMPWGSYVDLYQLPLRAPAKRIASHRFPGVVFLHDFIVTERHAIFFAAPLRLRPLKLLFSSGSIAQNLAWRPEEGASIMVIPLDEPRKAVRFQADPFMLFHFANAFERGHEIVADFIRYPDYAASDLLTAQLMSKTAPADPRSRLCRAVIDPARRAMKVEERWSRTCEFPIVAPLRQAQDYRYAYLTALADRPDAASTLPTAIAKVDLETGRSWDCEPGGYPSEPVFVPRPAAQSEDDGYLLNLAYDSGRKASALAVLDARDPERAPLAKAWFNHAIPLTFHGAWTA